MVEVYDPRWPRWIRASIVKALTDLADANGIPYFVEGMERKTNQVPAWMEIRTDGPWIRRLPGPAYRVRGEINVLCMCAMGRDAYQVDDMTGLVAAFLDTTSIGVFKKGTTIADDGTLIDCLNIDTSDRSLGIIIHNYGQVAPATKVVRSTVEAKWWMMLTEDAGGTSVVPPFVPPVPLSSGLVFWASKIADYNIVLADINKSFTNTGAPGAVNFQLPSGVPDGWCCLFWVDDPQPVIILPSPGSAIVNGGTVATLNMQCSIPGSMCTLVWHAGTATWDTFTSKGAWTTNP